ncbi:MAG: transposase [Pirellulales bacterium]|nr:transposase [Pirellulales bacterium]
MIDFSVLELLKQRMFALCLGYKDLNDHEQLRTDPLLAVWVGRNDPTGQDRLDRRDRGKPLAGKSRLNRLELTPRRANEQSRDKKIVYRERKIEEFFADSRALSGTRNGDCLTINRNH